jgi:hypothetical protein
MLKFFQVKCLRVPIKILTILLTICFITSNATLSWSGVCVNPEGSHSFSKTSRLLSCHVQELTGDSHCFTLEDERFSPASSGEGCVDLFFSSEVNLARFNQQVIAAVQLPLNQYGFIDSFTPHQKTVLIHPNQSFLPDKMLQMQRAVVLLI